MKSFLWLSLDILLPSLPFPNHIGYNRTMKAKYTKQISDKLLLNAPYLQGVIDSTISWRTSLGWTALQCTQRLNISLADYNLLIKHHKPFKQAMKQAKDGAKQWWITEWGKACLNKRDSDWRGIKEYLQAEFNYSPDSVDRDDEYGFDIMVRPKGGGKNG